MPILVTHSFFPLISHPLHLFFFQLRLSQHIGERVQELAGDWPAQREGMQMQQNSILKQLQIQKTKVSGLSSRQDATTQT